MIFYVKYAIIKMMKDIMKRARKLSGIICIMYGAMLAFGSILEAGIVMYEEDWFLLLLTGIAQLYAGITVLKIKS